VLITRMGRVEWCRTSVNRARIEAKSEVQVGMEAISALKEHCPILFPHEIAGSLLV
jgi:hypothetical protein